MKFGIIFLFISFLVGCGFKGSSDTPIVLGDGDYELYDDNNWQNDKIIWPLQQARLSQKFSLNSGIEHKGIDLATPRGEPVRASLDGWVVLSGVKYSGYGNMVIVKHNDNLMTVYAHLDQLKVELGESVSTGDIIGTVGSSGVATGNHLHFEVIKNDFQVDPLKYLNLSKLTRVDSGE